MQLYIYRYSDSRSAKMSSYKHNFSQSVSGHSPWKHSNLYVQPWYVMQHTPGLLTSWEWFSHLSLIFVSKRAWLLSNFKEWLREISLWAQPWTLIFGLRQVAVVRMPFVHTYFVCITACCMWIMHVVCAYDMLAFCACMLACCVCKMLCMHDGILCMHVGKLTAIAHWYRTWHAWWHCAYMMACRACMLAWSVQWML